LALRSPQEWLDVWRAALGNLQQAFAQLDASGQEQLANDLVALGAALQSIGGYDRAGAECLS
jgi:hypothetical protein